MILITGAGGMLGSYIAQQFEGFPVKTLGLKESSDFKCDLTKETPDFCNCKFDSVFHCAGTEDDNYARELNLEGTKRLLQGLEKTPPERLVFVSSFRVYSNEAGENVTEDTHLWASSEAGKSKALAETVVRDWCERNNVLLTIIRPARMFGNGVGGDSLQLFNDALSGKYIHIRGNDAKISLVTAYDVARGIKELYKKGGIYNAADGTNPEFIGMVEAMTANVGTKKRMTHLPIQWAEWIWRLGKWIPSIDRNLSPKVVENRMKTLTIDGTQFAEGAGIRYHDTIRVMEHTDPDYPYTEPFAGTKKAIHEA